LSPSSARISSPLLPFVTISRSEACEVRHRFNIPYEYVRHVMRLVQLAAQKILCG
jgi:hypothetical protein